MKKILFVAAVALLAFSSCNKDKNAPTANIEGEKIQMNLTATLEGGKVDGETSDAKRISYTDNSGLKGTWDATETITVVSLDASGKALHFDNFTSTGAAGRTTADFSGSITADANTASYICWYPALGSGNNHLTGNIDSEFNNWSTTSRGVSDYQDGNGNTAHLSNYVIMNGIPTIDGNNIEVTMQHALCAFKFVVTIPNSISAGDPISKLEVEASNESNRFFCNGTWSYFRSQNLNYGGCGGDRLLQVFMQNTTVPEDHVLTVYCLTRGIGVRENDTWTIRIKNIETTLAAKTITWNQDKSFEKGKEYVMEVTLVEP